MLRSILFYSIVFITMFLGDMFVLFPLLPLLLISPRLYRQLIDRIVGFYWTFPIACMELFYDLKCYVTGDSIDFNETSLIIMNHRTRLDWMFFLWSALFKLDAALLTKIKIALKSAIKTYPAANWAMEMNAFPFLDRRWEVDESILTDALDYYSDLDLNYKLLLFPEGTDYCVNSKKRSDLYAERKNLQKYEYVLHPKVTGFRYIVQRLMDKKKLRSLYDITLAFPDRIVQNELQFASGHRPQALCFHVRRYDVEKDLPPVSNSDELQKWLIDRWREKEEELQKFYESDTRRLSSDRLRPLKPNDRQKIFLAFSSLFWISLTSLWIYWLCAFPYMWLYVLTATTTFIIIGRIFGGIERLELYIWKSRRKIA